MKEAEKFQGVITPGEALGLWISEIEREEEGKSKRGRKLHRVGIRKRREREQYAEGGSKTKGKEEANDVEAIAIPSDAEAGETPSTQIEENANTEGIFQWYAEDDAIDTVDMHRGSHQVLRLLRYTIPEREP